MSMFELQYKQKKYKLQQLADKNFVSLVLYCYICQLLDIHHLTNRSWEAACVVKAINLYYSTYN